IASKVEFTNVKCTPLDPKFMVFEYCYLKSVNRTYKYLSVKTKMASFPLQKPTVSVYVHPVRNLRTHPISFQVNIELLKRYSGYKPFLYNVTVDVCRFMKNPKSSPIAAYFHGLFSSFSNMNHTCPYNHDLVVDKLPTSFINQQVTGALSFPHGDYLFHSDWFAYGVHRASVDFFYTLS
ncbi:hypothetical protein KR032_008076, partial [Drosophila birchii]